MNPLIEWSLKTLEKWAHAAHVEPMLLVRPNTNDDSLKRPMHGREILLLGLLFTLWTCGCRTSHHDEFAVGAEALLPKVAAVTTGPLPAVLLNGSVFESEFTMTLDGNDEHPLTLSGQLLVGGAKLRLEVASSKANGKPGHTGDFGVIWDVAAQQGYVFSETLQGYAPITAGVRFTNLLTQLAPEKAGRIEGHPVDSANATVSGSNGQTVRVHLARAQDLGNLPLKMTSVDSPYVFALVLSKIQLVTPAADLFLPPDGFTIYASEAAMLNELTAREQGMSGERHVQGGRGGDYGPPGGGHGPDGR